MSNQELNITLLKFWKSEELPEDRISSLEGKFCEEFFKETSTRLVRNATLSTLVM